MHWASRHPHLCFLVLFAIFSHQSSSKKDTDKPRKGEEGWRERSAEEHLLLFHRTSVQLPEPIHAPQNYVKT